MSEPDPSLAPVPDLEALEKARLRQKKKAPWWSFLDPFAGADFHSYKKLLRFVKPYWVSAVGSVLVAVIAAACLTAQLWILEDGLSAILGQQKGEVVELDGKSWWMEKEKKPSQVDRVRSFLASHGSEEEDTTTAAAQTAPGTVRLDDGTTLTPYDPAVHGSKEFNEEQRSSAIANLWWISALLIFAVSLEGLFKYWQTLLMTGASRGVIMDLRLHVFQHLMGLSTRFHQTNHSAHLVSRLTHDLNNFGRFLVDTSVRMVREFTSFVALLGYIVMQQGSFIFVVAVIVVLGLAPIQIFSRRLRKKNQATQAGMAEIYAYLTEALNGQRIVKAFNAEEREYDRFRVANLDFLKQTLRVRRLRAITEALVPTVASVGTGAVIVVGGIRVLDGKLEPAAFLLIIVALGRAMGSLRMMSKQINDFHVGTAAAERVGTLLAVESEIQERSGAPALAPFQHRIRFEHVGFAHERGKATLHDIDLEIKKGETVALVGPSGAGKSTLCDLLPRFFDPDTGRVTVDGVDIRDVTLRSVRAQIAVVTQETVLFRDSVADNIAYGRPDADPAEVRRAAKQANADAFIAKMPRGYRTPLGERGYRLSGGERQRIAIARALLKDPPILILDEATSALDSESERLVQGALGKLMKNRTVIVIAHRLSTVRNADRIVVLEKGRIVESGTHDELMAKEGLYHKLYEVQRQGMADHFGDADVPTEPVLDEVDAYGEKDGTAL